MADPDADEGFKVTDRRRRADAEAERDAPRPPESERVERPPAASPIIESTAREPARSERSKRTAAREERPVPEPGERDLTELFGMLASSAAMALGEAPDPLSGQVHVDLAQGAEFIDLLILLRQKTEGNRTPEESQLLDDLIYDLELRYVAATRRAGSPPGQFRS